jgi:thiol:disulfide interchange protein DsbG
LKQLTGFLFCLTVALGGSAAAGTWVPTAARESSGLAQQLERAKWFAVGATSSARVVYIFTDPDCPYCNDLWKAMQTATAPDVQIRYLLVAVIDSDSRGKDAAILESANPAATLERQERAFEKGGIAPKSTWMSSTNAAIATNESLMQELHIYGTPGLVYLDEHQRLRVFAGMPDPRQLPSILGKR